MAPSYSDTGAMVYLANSRPRRDMRGVVARRRAVASGRVVARGRVVSTVSMPHDAASEHELETAFAFRLTGAAHLKSFPSEKTKRGHYV
jgi:hypothetical protein